MGKVGCMALPGYVLVGGKFSCHISVTVRLNMVLNVHIECRVMNIMELIL